MRDLKRLLSPRSIAVVGGGAWCEAIVGAAQRIGFDGDIFPVHPTGKRIAGIQALTGLNEWPGPIDAAFLGINRTASIDAVGTLRELGAGGAVCFASGFSEAQAELADGGDLQAALVTAAGEMPILGPNCYGFINALDRVAIWPDQHGLEPVERGVAILTQSSNIAINLTMQRRGVPIAYVVTCGNMAQTDQARIARALLDDPRVTAIGVHVEGFTNLRGWERLAYEAHARGVALVALKVGRTAHAQAAAVSHTASLTGSHAGASALMARLGMAQVSDLAAFLEALKLAHFGVQMARGTLSTMSCSGGEASLMADTCDGTALRFPPLADRQKQALKTVLGPKVALENPLDYHTYIWRDTNAMAATFAAMADPNTDLNIVVADYPHTDASDWACVTDGVIEAHKQTGHPFAVLATLPELMPTDIVRAFEQAGVVALNGLRESVAALDALAQRRDPADSDLLLPGKARKAELVTEADAKTMLAGFGMVVPGSRSVADAVAAGDAAACLNGPVVLKGAGLAHKSEAGAVQLNLAPEDVEQAARDMGAEAFLVEEMVTDGVVELLLGVVRDPAHGFVLTLAAGGVTTELLEDSTSLLLPVDAKEIEQALNRLRCAPLLAGYRGRPAADVGTVVQAVQAVQQFVVANAASLDEVEINPLICTPTRAVAADALIRMEKD